MKRFLLVLLLLFAVPLQSSWAAVTGYCEYEQEGAASHVGHHEHHKDHGNAKGTLAKLHHDCSHHAGAVAIIANFTDMPTMAGADQLRVQPFLPSLSDLPDRPERPKWRAPSL